MSTTSSTSISDLMDNMTIVEYLRGVVAYNIPDSVISAALVKREVEADAIPSEMEEKDKDLLTADIYMWCASTPSKVSDTKDADGGWSHTEGGWETSAYDKRQLREMANALYAKWDEDIQFHSRFRIINF